MSNNTDGSRSKGSASSLNWRTSDTPNHTHEDKVWPDFSQIYAACVKLCETNIKKWHDTFKFKNKSVLLCKSVKFLTSSLMLLVWYHHSGLCNSMCCRIQLTLAIQDAVNLLTHLPLVLQSSLGFDSNYQRWLSCPLRGIWKKTAFITCALW